MKAQNPRRVSTLRLILAALKDRDIDAKGRGNSEGLGDDEILSMLQSMVKQRRDSIELYKQGKREELAAQEAEEIVVIEEFLPTQMSEGDVAVAVKSVIAELGAAGLKDMGRVMGALKEKYAGEMDFSVASGIVKSQLG